MYQLLWVFLGGGLGSICRFLTGELLKSQSLFFPWGTLTANAISCIILGVLMAYHVKSPMEGTYRLFLMTGFCGGFSTFSTFSGEIFVLFQDGKLNIAFAYLATSLFIGLLGIFLGFRLI